MRSAVIFDLDGTLTRPYLSFSAIRAELGLPPGPILEAIERMTPGDRQHAESVLHRHEREAAENAELHPGALETLQTLQGWGWPIAILTRNSRECSTQVLDKFGLRVDALRTRDDGAIKPSPEPVLALCRLLDADPASSWVVGDYLFDIQSGRAAGTKTVLLVGNGELPAYAHEADHVIQALPELLELIRGPST